MKRSFLQLCSSANTKSTLIYGVAMVCLAGMSSCSDDIDAPAQGGATLPTVDKAAMTVTSDADYLSQYVTHYRVASRSVDDSMFDFMLPSLPSVPADAKPVSELYMDNNTVNIDNSADAYVVAAGEVFNGKMNIAAEGKTIYVQGTFDGELVGNNNSCTVHLLPGAAWTNANNDVQPSWNIYKYKGSQLEFKGDISGWKGKLYADELVTDKNVTVTNGGVLYIEEGLIASDISINSGAKFTAHCVEGDDVYFTNGTDIYVSAYINAINLKLDSMTKLHMRGAGFVNVEKYLMCGNVTKSGASDMFVNEGSEPCVIATDYYFAQGSNQGDGKCSIANNLSGEFKLYIKQGVVNTFKYYAPAKLSEIPGQLGGLDSYAFDVLTKNDQTSLYAEGITPIYDSCTAAVEAQKPGAPAAPQPVLELISKVELDHKHPISATSIDLKGNQAFVSWHERGNNMKGCIEILNITSADAVTFEAWMETPEWKAGSALSDEAYDFNHLIYDQLTNSIITVGDHSKKGGFVAQIPLANVVSGVYEQKMDIMIPRQIPFAASGNSVLRYGDDLYIAGAGGYTIFPFGDGSKFPIVNTSKDDYTQKSECDSLATLGSAKHLALNGDKVATIEYTNRGADKLPAKISLWDASSWIKGSPVMETTIEDFGPTFGKDVIALDDQYIYSCQGTNGMAVYDLSGAEVARFKVNDYITKENGFSDTDRNKMRNSAANGLCVYGDYVFVANGGAGVWVLSKAKNFEPVAHFTDGGKYFTLENELTEQIGASANYVRVTADGYVYVAYGLGGVMVLKFNESAIK